MMTPADYYLLGLLSFIALLLIAILGILYRQARAIGRLEGQINGLNQRIDGLNERVDGLSGRIDGVEASLTARIDGSRPASPLALMGSRPASPLALMGSRPASPLASKDWKSRWQTSASKLPRYGDYCYPCTSAWTCSCATAMTMPAVSSSLPKKSPQIDLADTR